MICHHNNVENDVAGIFLRKTVHRIWCNNEEFRKYTNMSDMREFEEKCFENHLNCFDFFVGGFLLSTKNRTRPIWYLLVDGLDECHSKFEIGGKVSFMTIFKHIYGKNYPYLKIFATSRDNANVASSFKRLKRINIKSDNSKQKNDLLNHAIKLTQCDQRVAADVVRKASWNMLILSYILSLDVSDCEEYLTLPIPSTISEMYQMEFERIYQNNIQAFQRDQEVLEIIVTMEIKSLVTADMILSILRFSRSEWDYHSVRHVLFKYKSYLLRGVEEGDVRFIHSTLLEWLESDERIGTDFSINLSRGHKLWTKYLFYNLSTENERPMETFLDIVAFIIHVNDSKDDSFKKSLQGNVTSVIDKHIFCEYIMNASHCFLAVQLFAYMINDYTLMKTFIYFSKDPTPAVFMAIYGKNIENFNAFIDSGISLRTTTDTIPDYCFSYGFICDLSETLFDPKLKSLEGSTKNLSHEKTCGEFETTLRMYNFSNAPFYNELSLLHACISMDFLDGMHIILQNDHSVVDHVTSTGWDVLDETFYLGRVDVLMLLRFDYRIPVRLNFWHLYITCFRGHSGMLDFLFTFEIIPFDLCIPCKENIKRINASHIEIATYTGEGSKTFDLSSTYNKLYMFKYRHEVICESPCLAAIRMGHNDIVIQLLLRYGNNYLDCREVRGMTPLAYAVYYRNEECIRMLWDRSDITLIVRSKVYERNVKILNSLFLLPYENRWPKKHPFSGCNLAHLAALRPSCEVAKMLFNYMNTVNRKKVLSFLEAKDDEGRTPLFYSLCHDDADDAYKTYDFTTPRSYVMGVFYMVSGNHRLAKLLINMGLCGEFKSEIVYHLPLNKTHLCKNPRFLPDLNSFTIELKVGIEVGMHGINDKWFTIYFREAFDPKVDSIFSEFKYLDRKKVKLRVSKGK